MEYSALVAGGLCRGLRPWPVECAVCSSARSPLRRNRPCRALSGRL